MVDLDGIWNIKRSLDNEFVGKCALGNGDDAIVAAVEMAAIDPSCFQRFEDMAGMLVGTLRRINWLGSLLQEGWELGLALGWPLGCVVGEPDGCPDGPEDG